MQYLIPQLSTSVPYVPGFLGERKLASGIIRNDNHDIPINKGISKLYNLLVISPVILMNKNDWKAIGYAENLGFSKPHLSDPHTPNKKQ